MFIFQKISQVSLLQLLDIGIKSLMHGESYRFLLLGELGLILLERLQHPGRFPLSLLDLQVKLLLHLHRCRRRAVDGAHLFTRRVRFFCLYGLFNLCGSLSIRVVVTGVSMRNSGSPWSSSIGASAEARLGLGRGWKTFFCGERGLWAGGAASLWRRGCLDLTDGPLDAGAFQVALKLYQLVDFIKMQKFNKKSVEASFFLRLVNNNLRSH